MLGLRVPRLKTRPSLLELLAREEEEKQGTKPTKASPSPPGPAHLPLPPLPDLPSSSSSNENLVTSPSFSSPPVNPIPSSIPHKMAPKVQKGAGEADQAGSVFSVSGPVVVAENMIGCAMYELVCIGHYTAM